MNMLQLVLVAAGLMTLMVLGYLAFNGPSRPNRRAVLKRCAFVIPPARLTASRPRFAGP